MVDGIFQLLDLTVDFFYSVILQVQVILFQHSLFPLNDPFQFFLVFDDLLDVVNEDNFCNFKKFPRDGIMSEDVFQLLLIIPIYPIWDIFDANGVISRCLLADINLDVNLALSSSKKEQCDHVDHYDD